MKEIMTVADFVAVHKDANFSMIIIDFSAVWCGPCQRMIPKLNELAIKYPTVGFFKIDADNKEVKEITDACLVKSLPTFCFFIDGVYITKMIGANTEQLEKLIINERTKFAHLR